MVGVRKVAAHEYRRLDPMIVRTVVEHRLGDFPVMKSGAVFKSNTSQAIRIPKDVAVPDSVKRVDIISVGRGRLIVPAGEGWDSGFDVEGVTDDFMASPDQPADQEREQSS